MPIPKPQQKPKTKKEEVEQRQQQEQEIHKAEREKPPDYGDISAAELNALIPLEDRKNPDTETASKVLGVSVEVIKLYFGEHIVYPAPRRPMMSRRTVYDIAAGRIERAEVEENTAA